MTQYLVPSSYKYKLVPFSLNLTEELGQNSLCERGRLEHAREQWERAGRGENGAEGKRETDLGDADRAAKVVKRQEDERKKQLEELKST